MELKKLHKIECLGELVNPLFYCKETGGLYRQMRTRLREIKGIDSNGYCTVGVNGKVLKAHLVVAREFLGHISNKSHEIVVDHINGNKLDNRIENLQLISNRENVIKGIKFINKKGDLPTNVVWDKQKLKYRVQYCKGNKRIHLGFYDNIEDAANKAKLVPNLLDGK